MRIPGFSAALRTVTKPLKSHPASAITKPAHPRLTPTRSSPYPITRTTLLKAAPTIPFMGSSFSSSATQQKMSYPDHRSDDEWRAVLNPGSSCFICFPLPHTSTDLTTLVPLVPKNTDN